MAQKNITELVKSYAMKASDKIVAKQFPIFKQKCHYIWKGN